MVLVRRVALLVHMRRHDGHVHDVIKRHESRLRVHVQVRALDVYDVVALKIRIGWVKRVCQSSGAARGV